MITANRPSDSSIPRSWGVISVGPVTAKSLPQNAHAGVPAALTRPQWRHLRPPSCSRICPQIEQVVVPGRYGLAQVGQAWTLGAGGGGVERLADRGPPPAPM